MLVTAVPLTFTEADLRSVSVPAGTECMVFNRHMDIDAEADELIAQARHRNAVAGSPTWLVVSILGRARLLKRTELKTAEATSIEKPLRQAALF